MICPNCKIPITWDMPPEAIKRAKSLRSQGYSFRDMERILFSEGFHCSYSNLSKHFRKIKKAQD